MAINSRSRGNARRQGAALYLTTVAISVLVGVTGIALISSQRADRTLQANIQDENEAWWCAQAGIEMVLAYMEQVPNWRSRVTNNQLFTDVPVGRGTCTVELYDDLDTNVANDESQPVRAVAIADVKGSEYKLQVSLLPRPHPALSYAAFGTTSEDMEFKSQATVRGPVRSHGRIRGGSSVSDRDDASFETISGFTIDSILDPRSYVTTPIPAPAVSLTPYLAMATAISGTAGGTCTVKGFNLTPTSNSGGTANPNGIYSLNAGWRDVVIESIHVRGTLIIHNLGNKKVTIQRAVWMEPGPLNYPVLLVGPTTKDVVISPNGSTMPEIGVTLTGLNLNILTIVDYNEDGDILDTFSTSVRGVVWTASGRLILEDAAWPFVGCAINSHLIVDGSVSIDNDPQLQACLAPGFVGTGMRLVAGSFMDAP